MIEANRYKLGVFIATALFLIVATFFLVGLSKIFEPRLEVITVFRDSVEGLRVGSPVKYKGVPLGSVTRIAMRDSDEYIDVYMVIYASSMDTVHGENKEIIKYSLGSLHDYFLNLKNRGLRCSLQLAGLTGGAFIELDKPDRNRDGRDIIPVTPPEDVLYIPSRASHITAVIENLSKTAENLSKVDFIRLTGQLRRTLDSMDSTLNDPRLSKTIDRIDQVGRKIDSLMDRFNEKRLEKFYVDAQKCITVITKVVEEVNSSRGKLVFETIDLKKRFSYSLGRLNEALDSITQLADTLDENPSSIVRGKSTPEMFENKKKSE